MVAWWKEMGRPLAAFFEDKPLRKISPTDLIQYQKVRRDLGRAPKTVNSELSVLRQLLKYAKLWYRFTDDYKPLKNTKPPAGKALTDDEQMRLFDVARSNPAWFFAYVAATLDFFSGLRACEIRALQWKHVSLDQRCVSVRRSKTPAGWRIVRKHPQGGEILRSTTRVSRHSWNCEAVPSGSGLLNRTISSSRGMVSAGSSMPRGR